MKKKMKNKNVDLIGFTAANVADCKTVTSF